MQSSGAEEKASPALPDDSNQPQLENEQKSEYSECDIYHIFNRCHSQTCLIVDIRPLDDYNANHIVNSENFHIPNNLKLTAQTTIQQLTSVLNIASFKQHIFKRLPSINNNLQSLQIIVYGDANTGSDTWAIFHQLGALFRLVPQQLQILKHPGFATFDDKFPFLCVDTNYQSNNTNVNTAVQTQTTTTGDDLVDMFGADCEYPNSIMDDTLFLGNGTHAQSGDVFENLRISHVVNATTAISNVFEKKLGCKYIQVLLEDESSADLSVHFDRIATFIHDTLTENEAKKKRRMRLNRVLVHCEMGVSRSSSLIIAYLMKFKKMSLFDAYHYTVRCRQVIRPNSGFLQQLGAYEKTLFGSTTVDKVKEIIHSAYLAKMVQQQI